MLKSSKVLPANGTVWDFLFLRTVFSPSSALFPSNSKTPVFFSRSTFCPHLSLVWIKNVSLCFYWICQYYTTLYAEFRGERGGFGQRRSEFFKSLSIYFYGLSWSSEISCLHFFFGLMRLCIFVLLIPQKFRENLMLRYNWRHWKCNVPKKGNLWFSSLRWTHTDLIDCRL